MDKQKTQRRPIAVDLFSGAGGMSLGFEQAGFDIRFAMDKDGYHVATHKRNFPYGVTYCGSIVDLSGEKIRRLTEIGEDIDLVFGGPPCQGFSHMGARDESDPRNNLVFEFARIVAELRPKAFVMENVPGMQGGKTKEIFEGVIQEFEKQGYKITKPVRDLDAADFGVPQSRKRLFVLGIREDVKSNIQYPDGPLDGQAPRPLVAEALQGLPRVEESDNLFRDSAVSYGERDIPIHAYARIARGFQDDPTDFSRKRIWEKSICTGCKRTRHSSGVMELYAATKPGTMVPGHKLPRLDPDGISPTLRAGTDSENGSHTAPRPIHPFLPRVITAREAARLHGFPDWFSFYPAHFHAYRQIGNAVCPPVARAVGKEIIDGLSLTFDTSTKLAVVLDSTFYLPNNRPKHHRRIVQLEQFPKVVEWLFENAFDSGTERLLKSDFSFDDVRNAFKCVDVNLPRNRPERFIHDIARSRNCKKIMALPLSRGLTILPTEQGGKFVKVGTPGTVDEDRSIKLSSAELLSAEAIPVRSGVPVNIEISLEMLGDERVYKGLLGINCIGIEFEKDLFNNPRLSPTFLKPLFLNGTKETIGLLMYPSGKLPKKTKVQNLMRRLDVESALLICPLTNEHVLYGRYQIDGGVFQEVNRFVVRFCDVSCQEDNDELDQVNSQYA